MPIYRFKKGKYLADVRGINKDEPQHKRYTLKIDFEGERGDEKWLIILKNPSRAVDESPDISDKTISNVCEYFYRKMIQVNSIVVMNLFPVYETYSNELVKRRTDLVDKKNKLYLKDMVNKSESIVFAWGSHPKECKDEFDTMRNFVTELTKNKNCFQMKHPLRKINRNRPLHAQVWGYENYELIKI